MPGFEQFRRKPLTREQLEAESKGVRKTGEILRGMEEPNEKEKKEEIVGPQSRIERQLQALQNEVSLIKKYIKEHDGFEELQELRRRVLHGMSPKEHTAALEKFDDMFPDARKDIARSFGEIKEREQAIARLKKENTVEFPFEKAA